ncbi:cytochrome oxidase subunit VI [Trypanosoma equiperdum]|uniref:Cytochrome C oxidase subunit VI, putative n=5 Tax=Trypanozoon TaxID=39700 RepID=Q38CL0_TRYB2|nr:cytochrome C oxidase subunit VI, putative [Trypanosoma brucei gambiense DAL972]XP_822288.1 cytochrome C oxidase subunit VI, putative [Trypanosoma brucei brucei TREU927]AAC61680.1 putative cytochrome c oxidase subunit VI [Trypanosoma brucei rhodesiense]RHW68596.1 cytochrome oxidase subunit VI [Trypanosoma brucei equiperdum]SCU67055.1 cytochrome oxidase subunit VI [Trypanosoma equiperdum]EAN77460.1 cytochrome C oxidase subunit VI, putative [Trypanosoma brucei brucei TREU927]CBH14938.1 cytoch|eukprot:XP_011777204.1 cytochrome C oxidase subunit VI, putative [Trypanosoma brucei gambiense DAL972]
MPFVDHNKYKIQREDLPALPHFTDFNDPRFCGTNNKQKNGILAYYQWLHCVGNWGEEHSMCKKMRWYVERMMQEVWLEKWEEKRALGHFDHVLLYGVKPWKDFEPLYQPVKTNRKGAYEFWLDRDFEPLYDADASDFCEKAPILHDIFVKGKKPVYDE